MHYTKNSLVNGFCNSSGDDNGVLQLIAWQVLRLHSVEDEA